MTIPIISTLPVAPARTDAPATFISRADAFLAALVTMQGELNTSIGAMNADFITIGNNVTAAQAAQTAAETAETNAEAAQAAAESASNASLWLSGTSYSEGDVVYSPISYLSYRANTATSGTTDPSLSADWTPLSVDLPDQTGNNGKYLTTDGSNSSWNLITASDISDVTASAAELNKLDGVSTDTAGFNRLDTTLGSSANGKAMLTGSDGIFSQAGEFYVTNKFRAKEQILSLDRSYSSVSGAVTVDCSSANYHEMTLTGNVTFTFSNAEDGSVLVLKLLSTTGDTITWPASVEWPDGTTPTISGDCLFTFITPNSGAAWFGFLSGKGIA